MNDIEKLIEYIKDHSGKDVLVEIWEVENEN
jgi:hypothetical protein